MNLGLLIFILALCGLLAFQFFDRWQRRRLAALIAETTEYAPDDPAQDDEAKSIGPGLESRAPSSRPSSRGLESRAPRPPRVVVNALELEWLERDHRRKFEGYRLIGAIVVSITVLAAALYVILSGGHPDASEKWAFGAIGTIIGYWLKT